MSQKPCTLVHEEHKFMLMPPIKGDVWEVIDIAPYKGGALYYMDDVDIDKFIAANHASVKHSMIKREWIDILHAQPKAGFTVFKRMFFVEDGKLFHLFIDYQGSYGLYTCNEYGWEDRLICYGS